MLPLLLMIIRPSTSLSLCLYFNILVKRRPRGEHKQQEKKIDWRWKAVRRNHVFSRLQQPCGRRWDGPGNSLWATTCFFAEHSWTAQLDSAPLSRQHQLANCAPLSCWPFHNLPAVLEASLSSQTHTAPCYMVEEVGCWHEGGGQTPPVHSLASVTGQWHWLT